MKDGWRTHLTDLIEQRSHSPSISQIAGSGIRCEDVAVPPSAVTCAVCHRLRSRGSFSDDGAVFICAGCQADAKQLFEIQDRIYAENDASTGRIDKPADL
jgi:hypothetical protein